MGLAHRASSAMSPTAARSAASGGGQPPRPTPRRIKAAEPPKRTHRRLHGKAAPLSKLAGFSPESLQGYQRRWLSRDVIAGVTLAAVAIPETMGYTSIAQTPVITGLYTVIFPTMVFALLGSSRLLVVGADSATAAILAAGLAGL